MKNLKKLFIFLVLLTTTLTFSQETYRRTVKLMGSRFDITVIADNKEEGNSYIDLAISEISRIENLISSWEENSQTALINKNAGIKAVMIDEELRRDLPALAR